MASSSRMTNVNWDEKEKEVEVKAGRPGSSSDAEVAGRRRRQGSEG